MSRKPTVTRDLLLALLVVGGVLTVTAVAPGMLAALPLFFKKKEYDRRQIASSIRYVQLASLASFSQKDEMVTITLTKTGRKKVLSYQVDSMIIPRPKTWDGNWHLVIFDVPKKHNLARNVLREKLKLLGFSMLQESVWIHPFPCQKEIDFLIHLYGVQPFVKVLQVSSLPEPDERKLIHRYTLQNNEARA